MENSQRFITSDHWPTSLASATQKLFGQQTLTVAARQYLTSFNLDWQEPVLSVLGGELTELVVDVILATQKYLKKFIF